MGIIEINKKIKKNRWTKHCVFPRTYSKFLFECDCQKKNKKIYMWRKLK